MLEYKKEKEKQLKEYQKKEESDSDYRDSLYMKYNIKEKVIEMP